MRKHIMALIAMFALLVAAVTIGAGTASAAEPEFSTDPDNPTLVEEVPEGFTQTSATSSTDDCITTEEAFYERYTPGEDETTHQEYRFGRFVEGEEETFHNEWGIEERTRVLIPGQHHEAVTHDEYQYQKQVRHLSALEYQKYNYNGRYPNGNWHLVPGQTVWSGSHFGEGEWFQGGPEDTGSWFKYVPTGGQEWGPWANYPIFIDWTMDTTPNGHAVDEVFDLNDTTQGRYILAGTRTVTDSEAYDDPDTYGDWSAWSLIENGLTAEPTLEANTLLRERRLFGPVSVGDDNATEGYREFYTGPDSDPSRNIEDAAWVLDEAIEGWIRFDERTVGNGDGAEGFTEYVYTTATSGEPCEEEPPVEEPPVEEPPVEEPPVNNPPSNPNVPTSVDAGLSEPAIPASDQSVKFALLAGSGLLVMLAASMSLVAARRGTEQ